MAINTFTKYGPRATAPDANYPQGGRVKNESVPGANDGTPLDQDQKNDLLGYDEALFAETGITISGSPDTAVASQRLDAHKVLIAKTSGIIFDTVASMQSSNINFSIGDTFTIKQRANAIFEVVATASPNGFDSIDTTKGNMGILTSPYTIQSLGALASMSDIGAIAGYAASIGRSVKVENGAYNITSQDITLEAFSVFEGETDSQFVFSGGFGVKCNSTYFSGFRNMRLEGDDTGTGVSCSIGMKNFIFEKMLVRKFNMGLDWSNAFLGNINEINIEECDIGFRAVNAYMVNYQGLIIHRCRICFQYSGRSSLISNMDLSYFSEAGLDLEFARFVEFAGVYMEIPQQDGAVFVRFSGSGEKGVILSSLDLSSGNVANNLVYFDFDNGQVDTDVIIEHVNLKADGGTGHVGFKFGAAADSRITFQNDPSFEEVGGTFANNYIYGNARIEFRNSVNTEKVTSGNRVVSDHAFLESSTGPKYRRTDGNCNYESQLVDSLPSGSFTDLQQESTGLYGFITITSEDGVGSFFVDNRTTPGSGVATIVSDPQSILATNNPAPGSNKWSLVFSSGVYKLRNTWVTAKTAEARKSTARSPAL